MFELSRNSLNKLGTCDERIQVVFQAAIADSPFDYGITHGFRAQSEQFALYMQGRAKRGSKIVVLDKAKIVTYCDGYVKKSRHNEAPSQAVDIVAYNSGRITWEPFYYKAIASHIFDVARAKGVDLVWGGNWTGFKDYPHFELPR